MKVVFTEWVLQISNGFTFASLLKYMKYKMNLFQGNVL